MCVVARPSADVTFAFVSDVTERHESFRRLRERTAELDQLTSRLRRVSAELTLAEQAAREQLAKSLHDGLQQLLFAATLSLDRASKRVAAKDERATESLTKARGELEEAISTSRTLSVELFPRALHEGGLIAAIEWLASWMREKYGLTVELTGDPEAQIRGRDVRTLVFESVRELLFNAVKHASVESIKIEVTAPDDATVRVLVADRGAGFDPSVLGKSTDQQRLGLGLFTIRERLKLVGGRLDVESAPGSGSTFLLVAPNEEAGVG